MTQIALPLELPGGDETIVGGPSLQPVFAALQASEAWPYHTAVLSGPPRSGKSLMARWFAASGAGEAIDDADRIDEVALFHHWNRAQAEGHALLLVARYPVVSAPDSTGWHIALPDLASRLGAALPLMIGAPDDALLRALLGEHARRRGLALGEAVLDWLLPRIERSHAAAEALIMTLDRLSLERKAPVTLALAREALAERVYGHGHWQPRLL
ncbi:ATPase [Novosphingobium sp. Fuku2-ISO-50]|uniref:HdaA/DnaA family protein n=1 Tax=Novosphingobium sp. Fuku2-ISO-50 TaxID=1739114 RepID=UPI00076C338D|nr:ATPase [Novosphingobium sp. Fuku2-ISO-50]KUR80332.1 ATPase [Novosphingobium sp. Fuku2-ISO-50]